MELLGEDAVRCDGRDGATERQERIGRFNAGGVRFLVSKPQTKGVSRGQTMVSAHTVIYYNNTFSLEDRLQSEDRCHRSGQVNPVNYIDIVALGPNSVRIIDTHIVDALRNKMDIASQITGDQLMEWI
jgi:SNF2 family DNA or RNA helicase